MNNRACFNFEAPDFQANVKALKDAGIQNALFLATKDFMQYSMIRKPDLIIFENSDKILTVDEKKPAYQQAVVTINSTIFESEPGISEEKIEKIYDNYVSLMNRVRPGSQVNYEVFRSIINNLQVLKFKDTYIFGNYDAENAVFVTRLNSSPSSRELLAETIPNIVASGVDVISFVPEDYAKKLERSGYTISNSGFEYNFKGEEMVKYAAVSNPSVITKIFGKPLSQVTNEELQEYNSSFELRYTAVDVNSELIDKATNDLNKIMETYISNFGITIKDIAEIQDRLGIDALGFADILNRTAYIKDKSELPAVAGEFIAYMMQHNDLVKSIVMELGIKDGSITATQEVKDGVTTTKTNYNEVDKSKYFQFIGKLIVEELKNRLEGQVPKTILGKIRNLVKKFFAMLKDVNVGLINQNVGAIVSNILQQNKKLVTASLYKPGAYGKPTSQVSMQKALNKDKFGKDIIYALSNKGFILTGSTAIAEQGRMLRPDENPLHDIDWVSPFTRKETLDRFFEVYPEAQKVREIIDAKDGVVTDSYIIAPEGFDIKDLVVTNYEGKDVLESYDVVEKSTGNVVGTFRKEAGEEVVTGVEAKVIDFFTYDNNKSKERNAPFAYTTDDGQVIMLSNWRDIFAAKLQWARYKDIWDFNRFIPNELMTKEQKTTAFYEKQALEDDINGLLNFMYPNTKPLDTEQLTTASGNDTTKANAQIKELVTRLQEQIPVQANFISQEEAAQLLGSRYNGQKAFFYNGQIYFTEENLTTEMVIHEFAHPLVKAISLQNPEVFESLYLQAVGTVVEVQGANGLITATVEDIVKALYPDLDTASTAFKEEVIVWAFTEATRQRRQNKETGFKAFLKELIFQIRQLIRSLFGKKIDLSKLSGDTTLADLAMMLEKGGQFGILNTEVTTEEIFEMKEAYRGLADQLQNRVDPSYLGGMTKNFADTIQSQMPVLKAYRFNEIREVLKDEGGESILKLITDKLGRYSKTLPTELEALANMTRDQDLLDAVDKIIKTRDYDQMLDILQDQGRITIDEYNDLKRKVALDLSEVELDIFEKIVKFQSDLTYFRDRAVAIVESIEMVEDAANKMYQELKEIVRDPNNRENIRRAHAYADILKYWKKTFTDMKSELRKQVTDVGTLNAIDNVINNIDKAVGETKKIYKAGTIEVITEQLRELQDHIDEVYERNMKAYQDANMPQWMMDRLQKEYEKASIRYYDKLTGEFVSLEKSIEMYLNGELGDAHAFNSLFEGYMYNQDPIIAGFASFVKDNYIEITVRAQEKMNNMIADLRAPLAAMGYNPTNIDDLGKQTAFLDEIAYINSDTKQMEVKKVWALLNPFKNYRAQLAIKQEALKRLRQQAEISGDAGMYEELKKEELAYQRWLRKYFHQPYSDEIYKFEEKHFGFATTAMTGLSGAALDRYNELGFKIKAKRDFYIDRMNFHRSGTTPEEIELYETYRQAYNNLSSLTDLKGNKKTGEALEIAKRLQDYNQESEKYYEYVVRTKAFNKAYNNKLQEVKDVVAARLSRARLTPEQYAEQFDAEVKSQMKKWLYENTTVKIKKEFWSDRADIIDEIKRLTSRIVQDDDYLNRKEKLIEEKKNILVGKKNNNLQYDIDRLTPEQIKRLAEIEDELEELDELRITNRGLTKKEYEDYLDVKQQIYDYNRGEILLTNNEVRRLKELKRQYDSLMIQRGGLSAAERKYVNDLWQEYNEMAKEIVNEKYIETFNALLDDVYTRNPDAVNAYLEALGLEDRNITGALEGDVYLRTYALDRLMEDPEFEKWFRANHKIGTAFDEQEGEYNVFRRRSVWNNIVPVEDRYYQSYDVPLDSGGVNTVGKDFMDQPRVPSRKYEFRRPKEAYITQEIVGETVNNRGQWLPKNKEQMQAYVAQYPEDFTADEDPMQFINERYYAIKEDPGQATLMTVIEQLTKHLLLTQEDIGINSRLYMDIPRFYKSGYETVISGGLTLKNNPITRLVQRIRDFLLNAKSSFLQGNNYEDEVRLVNLDMMDDQISGVQIAGVQLIDDTELVSLDVINSMMRYMLSAERQKQLIKMLPTARALKASLEDEDGEPIGGKVNTTVDKKSYIASLYDKFASLRFLRNKDETNRYKYINALIDREFKGITEAGPTADMTRLTRLSQIMFGRASFGYFAFNIPSAIKNNLGQKFQAMLHAVGGQDYTFKDLAYGEAWSFKVSTMISSNIYNREDLPLELDLVEIFDPGQGRTEKKFGDRFSRTFFKDMFSSGIFYNTREWLQLQAQLQVFGASMKATKLKQYDSLGGVTEINYLDAWEKKEVDGVMQTVLKEGIDPEYNKKEVSFEYDPTEGADAIANRYGLTMEELEKRIAEHNAGKTLDDFKTGDKIIVGKAKKFKKFVRKQHDIQNKLSGAYAPWEQPEAQRYLLFRLVSYLRRYFTRMFLYRFQFRGSVSAPVSRINIASGELEMGWYIQALRAMVYTIATKGDYLKVMTGPEKIAAMRTIAELTGLITLGFIIPMALGWDEDDDDKYEKLRERSGTLPFLFAPEDPDYEFSPIGFLTNHALLMSFYVRQENESFFPWFGFGADDYVNMANLSSIAYGPTIESYVKSVNAMIDMVTGDDSAYYKRQSGPYIWQQEGGSKAVTYMAKMLGLTGSSLDPVTALRNFQSYRDRGL